ncbi:MAG TPA: hypothetical protein VHW60_19605 [Caulobacteraceae bacterium]|jgi:hypothetical protein|nr:hypothetical protein [Caulobacteraceae bacterium]
MSSSHPLSRFTGPRRVRTLLMCVAIGGIVGGVAFTALGSDGASGISDRAYLVVLMLWVGLGLGFAWMRFRPRKPYDEAATRPKAEAFQAKRAALLLVCAAYIAAVVTPMTIYEALYRLGQATLVGRLFDAGLFLAPCGLAIGLITTGVYSREWGRLVDDELTLAYRAAAFKAGFAVFAALGAAAFALVLFRPEWAVAALAAVLGLSVTAASVRFALLERAAAAAA